MRLPTFSKALYLLSGYADAIVPAITQINQQHAPKHTDSFYTQEIVTLTITGQRGNAVLVGEDDWRAIQETLHLTSIPGMTDSINQARAEGVEAGSVTLNW